MAGPCRMPQGWSVWSVDGADPGAPGPAQAFLTISQAHIRPAQAHMPQVA